MKCSSIRAVFTRDVTDLQRTLETLHQAHPRFEREVTCLTDELKATNEQPKKEIERRQRTEALLKRQKTVLELVAAASPLREILEAIVGLIDKQCEEMLLKMEKLHATARDRSPSSASGYSLLNPYFSH